jgi:hypothetical protein
LLLQLLLQLPPATSCNNPPKLKTAVSKMPTEVAAAKDDATTTKKTTVASLNKNPNDTIAYPTKTFQIAAIQQHFSTSNFISQKYPTPAR